jgi:hypothetical protein
MPRRTDVDVTRIGAHCVRPKSHYLTNGLLRRSSPIVVAA